MSEILDNIYIDRSLLVAFVKYILSQIYILSHFYPKASNFHNSGTVGCGKLYDHSMNNIVNVVSVGLQYPLSFKCYNNAKSRAFKIQG